MSTPTIDIAKLLLDTSTLEESAAKARQILAGLDASVQRTEKEVQQQSSRLASLVGATKGAVAAYISFEAAAAAVRSVTAAVTDSEQASARLDAILKATGGTAGKTAEDIQAMALSLAHSSLFDDEAITNATAVMLTFRSVTGETFDRAIKDALDLSAAFGQDLQGTVIQVGKALEDPVQGLSALKRVGVSFSAEQKTMITQLVEQNKLFEAQALVLEGLEVQVKSAAEAMHTGLSGALHDVKLELGNLLEAAGDTESMSVITDFLNGVSGKLREINTSLERPNVSRLIEVEAKMRNLRALGDANPLMTGYAEDRLLRLAQERDGLMEVVAAEEQATWAAREKAKADGEAASRQAAADSAREKAEEKAREAAKKRAEDEKALVKQRQDQLDQYAQGLREEIVLLTQGAEAAERYRFQQMGRDPQRTTRGEAGALLDRVQTMRRLEAAQEEARRQEEEWDKLFQAESRAQAKQRDEERAIQSQFYDDQLRATEQMLERQEDLYARAGRDIRFTMEDTFAALFDSQIRSFNDFAARFLAGVQRILAQLASQQLIQAGANALFGAFGGFNTGYAAMPAFHSGGVVGAEVPTTRLVSPALFAGAPRYHGGGIAGLRGDEVPAILQRGEAVLTPAQMRALGGTAAAMVVHQAFHFQINALDGPSVQRTLVEHRQLIAGLAVSGIQQSRALGRAVGVSVAG